MYIYPRIIRILKYNLYIFLCNIELIKFTNIIYKYIQISS